MKVAQPIREPQISESPSNPVMFLAPGEALRSLLPQFGLLLLVWVFTVVFIDPRGEFMVNDDWSFVKLVEGLNRGELIATGWGAGGPSALVHAFWGKLFTDVFGFTLTNLRLSVLSLSIASSFVLLLLGRMLGAHPWIAFIAVCVLVMNPLFLAESFTFMTDNTFASLLIFSIFFITWGLERRSSAVFVVGLIFTLLAILTRQIGVVAPAALIGMALVRRGGPGLGRMKLILLVLGVTIAPWIAFEFFLKYMGSTPVTSHEVVRNIFLYPFKKGFPDYFVFLFSEMVLVAIGYVGFFMAPLTALDARELGDSKPLKVLAISVAAVFAIMALVITLGIYTPPIVLHRNVIFNLGIGPIILKDIYDLDYQRTILFPPVLYTAVVAIAVLSGAILVRRALQTLSGLWSNLRNLKARESMRESSLVWFLAAVFYWGVIGLSGFHDRYLISLLILVIVWYVATFGRSWSFAPTFAVPAFVVLAFLAAFSWIGVHDFMQTKRALVKAQTYVTRDLRVHPCDFDGGFEFNGYHCYDKDYTSHKGMSWWWVTKQDYALTLGPLPDFSVVKTFPIGRIMEKDAAIYVLKEDMTVKNTGSHE